MPRCNDSKTASCRACVAGSPHKCRIRSNPNGSAAERKARYPRSVTPSRSASLADLRTAELLGCSRTARRRLTTQSMALNRRTPSFKPIPRLPVSRRWVRRPTTTRRKRRSSKPNNLHKPERNSRSRRRKDFLALRMAGFRRKAISKSPMA